MTATTLATTLPQPFRARLSDLRQQHADIESGARQLAAMIVKFCRLYYDVTEDAEHMPDKTKTAALAALEAGFSHVDASVRSKWRTIGKHAPTLLRADILKALPPTRDALYELAKTAPDKLSRLVKSGKVTQESSVVTIRRHITTPRRAAQRSAATARGTQATVTLGFATYTDAAAALAALLKTNTSLRVTAAPAFTSAVKALLGPDDFPAVARRFS